MPLIGREKVAKMTEDYYLKVNTELRKIAVVGFVGIIKGTPVDEGRARNNWFLSVDSPSQKQVKTKTLGLQAIRSISSMPKRILNNKIFFTNNLPYIGVLEYGGYPKQDLSAGPTVSKTRKTSGGFSTQAPGGWVRKELIVMRNKVRAIKT